MVSMVSYVALLGAVIVMVGILAVVFLSKRR